MKLLTALCFALALAAGVALATDLTALPLGQVLLQGDTSVVLLPQNDLPPQILEQYQRKEFGLMVAVMSGRPSAATLQVRALIETEDGLRRWFRTEVPYQLPASGSAWVPVFFNTGSQRVTAVYGLRVLVIDAGQEQIF